MTLSECNDDEGIVFEAEGKLFVVNRLRLVQGSDMFRDMFALGPTDVPVKGDGTIENPIPTGDDATAFRDFLWALRVRPPELMVFLKSDRTPEKVIKLGNIARLSHKYQDFALANWALEQLHETLSSASIVLTGPALKPLIGALSPFDPRDKKAAALVSLIRQRIDWEAVAIPDASPSIDLIALVAACAAANYTTLLPAAYYALLVSLRTVDWIDDPRLSEPSKRQLLGGAYRISEEWHKLVSRCPRKLVGTLLHTQQLHARPADLLAKLKVVRSADAMFSRTGPGSMYRDDTTGIYAKADEYQAYVMWKAEVDNLLIDFPNKLSEYFRVPQMAAPQT
ncbi:hypothetical protein AURDEDRAFT_172825 [Auricularia subglabra TFB-10046 SS5]|nr:hypothetical protein AURDEDRAFT_172825 [Auricularia subglabra TFB-10046 SS5]